MDMFDPRRLTDEGDDERSAAEQAFEAIVRDGVMVSEQLRELDSFAATMKAIGGLTEPSLKSALLATLIAEQRARGMTDAQFQRWLLKDRETLGCD